MLSRFSGSIAMPRTTRYQWPRIIARLTLPRMAIEESAPAIDHTSGDCVAARQATTPVMTYAATISAAAAR